MSRSLSLTPEEEIKVKAAKDRYYGVVATEDVNMLTLAEFGIHFGFEGIRAILNNEIQSLDDVHELIYAARKLKGQQ